MHQIKHARAWIVLVCLGWAYFGNQSLDAASSKPKNTADRKPVFSPSGGVFPLKATVSLSLPSSESTPSNSLVYTLDGSEPHSQSSRYQKPIAIDACTRLRARVLRQDGTLGPIASAAFFILDADLADFSSNLPLGILDSFGQELSRDRKNMGWIRLAGPLEEPAPSNQKTRLDQTPHFEGPVQVNIRGRASLRYPKRSYTLKLLKENGEDREASLFGMSKDEDWILYAPYPDKTLMRDVLAYEMSRDMGHWAPRTRFIEMFVHENGKRISRQNYMGVYVLEERIKRHPDRVHIDRLTVATTDDPDITGGYIFKKDHVDRGYYGPPDLLGGGTYVSSNTNKSGFPTPPGGFPADPEGFLPTFKGSSRSRDGSESSSSSSSSSSRRIRNSRPYTNILTLPLAIPLDPPNRSVYYDDDGNENVTLQESGFVTQLRTNQFYYVEPEEDEITPVQKHYLKSYLDQFESVLYGDQFNHPTQGYAQFIEPRSFIDYHLIAEVTKNVDAHRFSTLFTKPRGGKLLLSPIWDWNLSFGNCNGKQGWIPEYWLWPQLTDLEYSWFRRLFEDPDFGQRYVDRWAELRSTLWKTERLTQRIDALARLLEEAQTRNFERWPILGKPVNPNQFVGETYAEEVAWMKGWLTQRLAWMEAQFLPIPQLSKLENDRIRLLNAPPTAEVYWTQDGSDPRAPGGSPRPEARKATSNGLILETASQGPWVVRTKVGDRWSPPARFSRP